MSTRGILFAVTAAAVISATVISATTACGTSTPPSASSAATSVSASAAATTSPAEPGSAAGPQSACDALRGTVVTDQRCEVEIATADYEIGFNFPADYPDQQRLTDYLTQERDEFIDYIADRPPRGFPYRLDVRATAYHSGTPTSGTVSLVIARSSDEGAHPVTHYDAFTHDVATGVPITLDTLFKPGIQPVEILDPIVRRELEKKSQGAENPMPDNTLGLRMYENFAVTDEAVIFFIGQGAWLSQLAGSQRISVPRSELASVLA